MSDWMVNYLDNLFLLLAAGAGLVVYFAVSEAVARTLVRLRDFMANGRLR